jgi:hypothetical protein
MSSYSILSDIELVFLLKEGDKNAFNEIYERYKYILHAHAINKIRDREEARDIIQEVFIYIPSFAIPYLIKYLTSRLRKGILTLLKHILWNIKYKQISKSENLSCGNLLKGKSPKFPPG